MFGRKKKPVVNAPSSILANLKQLDVKDKKKRDGVLDDITKSMGLMRDSLYGLSEHEADAAELADEIYSTHFIPAILESLPSIPFDARKHFKDIFAFFMHHKEQAPLLVDYLAKNPQVLFTMIHYCKLEQETALICCGLLEAAFEHPALCALAIKNVDIMGELHQAGLREDFAVSASAFGVYKQLCTTADVFFQTIVHQSERERIFLERMHTWLQEGSIVLKRKTLHLLQQILEMPKAQELRAFYASTDSNLQRLLALGQATPELVPRMASLLGIFIQGGSAESRELLVANRPMLLAALEPAKLKKGKPDEVIVGLCNKLAAL